MRSPEAILMLGGQSRQNSHIYRTRATNYTGAVTKTIVRFLYGYALNTHDDRHRPSLAATKPSKRSTRPAADTVILGVLREDTNRAGGTVDWTIPFEQSLGC